MDIKQAARDAAIRNEVPVDLFLGLVQQESNFRSDALSKAGAKGPGQLMPATARELNVNPDDPIQNLDGSARYFKQQLVRFKGDPQKALAAYNAGPGAVERYGGIPPYRETQNYVAKVMENARSFGGGAQSSQPSAPSAPAGSDKTGTDWLSAFLAPLDTSSPAAAAAGSRQMPAFMAPLAAAALAIPSLKTTGQPLAGYRMQETPSPNALAVAAKALVQSGPLSALQPEPLTAPAAQKPAPAAGADQQLSNSLPQLGTTGERVDMGPRNISSIVPDRNQPGFDLYFEDKRFPALLSGRVKEIGRQGNQQAGYGNFVVIESPDPKTGELVDVLYGHLADGSTRVKEGDPVSAGQPIGTQGGTGSVRSADGTIASVDFLHPAPKGSGSMTPYRDYRRLVDDFSRQFRIAS